MGSKMSTTTEAEWELVDAVEYVSEEDMSEDYSDDEEEEAYDGTLNYL